jgi:hypothetical protein
MTIAAVCVVGVVISIAAWPPTPWPPVIAMFIAGLAIGSLNFGQTTLLQLGVRPLSFLLVGAIASGVDVRYLFVALGVMALMVGAVLLRLPEVREAR